MFGFSIFLNQPLNHDTKEYIAELAELGFNGVFTSLHIPEDDAKTYKERLTALGKETKKAGLELMVDISGDALAQAGFSFYQLEELFEIGVTGLRMDYHISNQQIADLSKQMKISLNASTLTNADIAELQQADADFKNLEAWHNYYPRPETGLDYDWFCKKNHWLKAQGFTVQAFVPGDEHLRGPLFEGLPSLERHRNRHPLAAGLELLDAGVDLIYIGDAGLNPITKEQWRSYLQNGTILLHAESTGSQYFPYVLGEHQNRQDEARDVIRSADARFKEIPLIQAEKPLKRERGAVTLDNERYQRYMGEIQIIKCSLPADEKVNVVANIIEKDRPLIDQIKAGTKYIIRGEKHD